MYHAGDFKNIYGALNQGLSGTSFSSGIFFTTTKEACENQGAGFNLEHKRPVYSFDLSGLNLFPTTWQDCKTLNLFNKCLYYWPVYQAYGPADVDYQICYKPIYNALLDCFEDYYVDDVSEDKRASKFLNELRDGYQIEANDIAEITGEQYDFSQYVQDNRRLRRLADKLRSIESDAHNTFPVLSKLMLEGDADILKNKINESKKLKENESHLLANILESIVADMMNWANDHYDDCPDKCAWLEEQADQLFDIAEIVRSAGYEQDLIIDIEEIEKTIEEGSGCSDDVYDFARDISQALKDFKSGKEDLYESTAEIQYNYNDLKNELENFIDKYELATSTDSMLQKVADLVGIDKGDLVEIANEIASQYNDLYDKTTGRFNNWSAPKDDLFATQLLIKLGYQGTYPIDDKCDSTEWGGVVFHLEDAKAIEPANDTAKQQLGERTRRLSLI